VNGGGGGGVEKYHNGKTIGKLLEVPHFTTMVASHHDKENQEILNGRAFRPCRTCSTWPCFAVWTLQTGGASM
jgi:hypothetical protein